MNQTEAAKIKRAVEKLCLQMGQGMCPSIKEIRETIALMEGHPEMNGGKRDLEEVLQALKNVEFSTQGKEWNG